MAKLVRTLAFVMAAIFVAAALVVAPASQVANAYDPFGCGGDCSKLNDPSLTMGASNFKAKNIINTVLQVLGGVAVIMVIVGGIRITAAHGDPAQVKAGRETILYAVVGLIVAVSAYAIINFVVSFNW